MWQPVEADLKNIESLLASSRNASNETHHYIQQQIAQFSQVPQFYNYLAYILVKYPEPDIRQMAGLVLKSNIKSQIKNLPPDVLNYVKECLLHTISDPIPYIRNTVGIVVTTILSAGGLSAWPQILKTLTDLLSSQDQVVVDGAFSSLVKICEDCAPTLDEMPQLVKPFVALVPRLIDYMEPSVPTKFRSYALDCIQPLLYAGHEAILMHFHLYLPRLFTLTQDPSPEVKRRVCTALVLVENDHPEYLTEYMSPLMEFMLTASSDQDGTVAKEACEFWSMLCHRAGDVEHRLLEQFLPRLVPVLLTRMVYGPEDFLALRDTEHDASVPDRPEDIQPHFGKGRGKSIGDEAEEEDEEDDEDGGGGGGGDVEGWTLRKSAANALDRIAARYRDVLSPILLPQLFNRFEHATEWHDKEVAILALGAVAEGCYMSIQGHLNQLVPYLLNLLKDNHMLIRSITCWTLSRYCHWVVQNQTLMEPLLQLLLERMLDDSKRVQQAACSAVSTLEEAAGNRITPYLNQILTTFHHAFQRYQAKSLIILYDAVGTMAEAVGQTLRDPAYVNLLLPSVLERWQQIADTDRNLCPLMECVACLVFALGPLFHAYVQPIFQRCVKVVEHTVMMVVAANQNIPNIIPEEQFIVCSLDLIAALCDSMGANIESLVGGSNLVALLYECILQVDQFDVLQSSFALVGDLARHCVQHLKPYLSGFVTAIVQYMTPHTTVAICNNALWCVGMVAVGVGAEMKPYVPTLVEKLMRILCVSNSQYERIHFSVLENAAITLGRLGLVAPEVVAPHLPDFFEPWCSTMRSSRDDMEKEHAFRGFCLMIQANPAAVIRFCHAFFDAVFSVNQPSEPLREMIKHIIISIKTSLGPANWAAFFGQLSPQVRTSLVEKYGAEIA
eukprot:GILK01000432.1.p1 GENE.GILK01000432.1~~GILK01000432.1.p1  ORF type:complete len:897 (+),score=156.57 GILK01000432.1:84-2774(+)